MQDGELLVKCHQPTNAAADAHADVGSQLFGDREPRLCQSLPGRSNCQVREGIVPADLLVLQIATGLKVPDLSSEPNRIRARINFLIGPMPERPWQSASQVSSTVCPRAVMSPIPVITTRFIAHTPFTKHPISSLPTLGKTAGPLWTIQFRIKTKTVSTCELYSSQYHKDEKR